MNRLRNVLILGGILLVAAAIAGVAQPHLGGAATTSTTTITVNGNGTVNAVPDKASFDFGVTTNGSTAAEALSSNSDQARAIIAALKNAGVDSSDIQTSQVSLWPQTSSDGTKITGYQASNTVTVTAPLAQAGDVVDAAVGAGANSVDGPNLDVADQSALYDQALKLAIADAKGKAQAIADATGLALGGVVKVTEGSTEPTPLPFAEKAAAGVAAAPPIEAGTQQIQASVTVTYSAG